MKSDEKRILHQFSFMWESPSFLYLLKKDSSQACSQPILPAVFSNGCCINSTMKSRKLKLIYKLFEAKPLCSFCRQNLLNPTATNAARSWDLLPPPLWNFLDEDLPSAHPTVVDYEEVLHIAQTNPKDFKKIYIVETIYKTR